MPKLIPVLLISLFLYTAVHAQTGGIIYYLKNSGKLVSKDSADYSMAVLPPDTSIDAKLYRVSEYYPNGKPRLITSSKTNDINLLYQGRYIAYFPNGKKRKIGNYENGEPLGHEVDYYPNGRFYSSKDYIDAKKVLLKDCRDSTGNILAENGNGKWIQYNEDFDGIDSQGNIREGLKDSIWHENVFGNDLIIDNLNGVLISSKEADTIKKLKDIKVDKIPLFLGGAESFGRYLALTMHYPRSALINHVQGRINIGFIVERNGTLTNISVFKGVDADLGKEALRVITISPPWTPAMQNGHAVRVFYTVPIQFTLSE